VDRLAGVLRRPLPRDRRPAARRGSSYDQNIRRGIFVSRADVAHYMLWALDQPETFRRTVGIAN